MLFGEVLKNCINHNSTETFPFVNTLVKYTPVTGCPALYDVLGQLLKKFLHCLLHQLCVGMKKKKGFLLQRNTIKEIFFKILLFIIYI